MAAVKIYLPHSLFALAHWASFPNLIRFFKFGAHLCSGPGTLGPQEMGGFFPWLERWLSGQESILLLQKTQVWF